MKNHVVTPQFVLALGLLLPAVGHAAAITYDAPGSSYTQDFNSLGNTSGTWTNGTTLAGWHWVNANGNLSATYTAEDGDASQSRLLALGTDGSSERAFGAQNGNNIENLYYGAQILNATGGTLDSFSLSYIGEQWRAIANEGQDKLTFEYQISASGTPAPLLVSTGWTNVEALDFNAPQTRTSSTKLDGNLAVNQVSISATATGLVWADGQELWLRWTDNNPVNNAIGSLRAMIGIDDVSFSATSSIPEPGAYALLLAVVTLGFTVQRRARRR